MKILLKRKKTDEIIKDYSNEPIHAIHSIHSNCYIEVSHHRMKINIYHSEDDGMVLYKNDIIYGKFSFLPLAVIEAIKWIFTLNNLTENNI